MSAVYGLLLHRLQQVLESGGEAIYQVLQELKKTGQIQKVGVSVYASGELEALIPRYRFDLVQAPFNLVDRRLHTSGWLQRLKDEDVEIHTRSAFLQGLLLMPQSTIPAKFAAWSELWRTWHEWLEQSELTPLQACLRYALSFSQISKVIVGVDNLPQLKEILVAAAGPLPQIPDALSTSDLALINPVNWVRSPNPATPTKTPSL